MTPGITCDIILESVSTRTDGSLSLRLSSPELQPDEMVAVFGLRGRELKMLLQPVNNEPITTKEIRGILSQKTQSERIRGFCFAGGNRLGNLGTGRHFTGTKPRRLLKT